MLPPFEIIRAARVALGLSQSELASLSNVSPRTVYRVEKGEALMESVVRIKEALEREGIIFIPADDVAGPGMRLSHAKGEQQQRPKFVGWFRP